MRNRRDRLRGRKDDAVLAGNIQDVLAGMGRALGAPEAEQRTELLRGSAVAWRTLGLHDRAADAWQRALAAEAREEARAPLRRQLADSLTEWGTALKLEHEERGERPTRRRGSYLDDVLDKYERALAIEPEHALAHYNVGVVHAQLGRLRTAKRSFERALASDPTLASASFSLGLVAGQRGRHRRAIRRFEEALRLQPGHESASRALAQALNELGNKKKEAGDLRRATALYERALDHDAQLAVAWYNLGVAHGAAGRHQRARRCYEIAIILQPGFAEAYNNLGVRANDERDLGRALRCYEQAVALKPDYVEALSNLGGIYVAQGQLDEARRVLERALALRPDHASAWNNLANLAGEEGDMAEVQRCYERAAGMRPECRNTQHNRLMTQNYVDGMAADQVFEEHAAWGRGFDRGRPRAPWGPRDPDRPLRVGYLSPDFSKHSVGYFIEGVLANHSPAVAAFCYANVPLGDEKTAHFERLAHAWRPVHGLSAEEVAARITEDRIDLLVELAGHTAHNRLDVMALRPAAVQLTYLGYPNTTGLTSIDYRITDALADPHDTPQRFTEELLRVPGCFLCYTPPAEAPPVGPPPSAARGYITFVSFNNPAKMNDRVLALWSRVLAAAPLSRLLLKNKSVSHPATRERLLDRLEEAGIDPGRVACEALIRDTRAHLAVYDGADLSLDTFPYAGTTTTCEALYMGVPVVTLSGASHAHNVGRSILTTVGLPELVARSEDEYVAIAAGLAGGRDRVAALRASLRPRMLGSPLCDCRGFTQRLERRYRAAWRRICEPPQAIAPDAPAIAC